MGWHYILTFKAKILPEHIPFIQNRYLMTMDDDFEFYHKLLIDERYYPDDERRNKERERIAQLRKRREEEDAKREEEYQSLPKFYRDIIDIWRSLSIGHHFCEYELEGDIFTCEMSKKVNNHTGDLREAYVSFLKDIIAPISSEIIDCEIESDDYGNITWRYSDSQLRNIHFRLEEKIKSIEHIYNEDESEIIETRVIYKHSIKRTQFLDLNRAYGLRT
jgi:hypothetical protein